MRRAGAEGGSRTRTPLPGKDFKSLVSAIPPLRREANYTIACGAIQYVCALAKVGFVSAITQRSLLASAASSPRIIPTTSRTQRSIVPASMLAKTEVSLWLEIEIAR